MKKTKQKKIFLLAIISMLLMTCVSNIVLSITPTFDITATAGSNGIIDPSGIVTVDEHMDQAFTITANSGYHILDVEVDSVSQGAISSYTFFNVIIDHTINVTFASNVSGPSGTASGDYLGYIDTIVIFDSPIGGSAKRLVLSPNGTLLFHYVNAWQDRLVEHLLNDSANVASWNSDLEICHTMAISPSGTRLGYGGIPTGAPGFDFWNITGWSTLNDVSPHGSPIVAETTIRDLVFSPNSSYFAYVGEGSNTIKILKYLGFSVANTINDALDASKFIDWNGNWIASGLTSDDATIYFGNNGTLHKTLSSTATEGHDVVFSPDGKWLAVCHSKGTSKEIDLWNVTAGFTLDSTIVTSSFTLGDENESFKAHFTNNSRFLFVTQPGELLVYSVGDWGLVYTLDLFDNAVFDLDVIDNVVAVADGAGYSAKVLNIFSVNRSFSPYIEYDNVTFTLLTNITGLQNFVIPTSANTSSVIVYDNVASSYLTEVYSLADLTVNNSYYFDLSDSIVYVRRDGLGHGTFINLTIIGTHDILFDISFPQYLEVGDYFFANGLISDSSGHTLNGVTATTHVLLSNGTDAITPMKWNCTNGNYICMFSTNALPAGTYYVKAEFPDPTTGVNLSAIKTLYLSVDPGPGVYVSTNLHFSFYNANTGIGLPKESFKIYVDTDANLTGNRIYVDTYKVYTGRTIYYRIDDYFDNKVYPTSGSYKALYISHIEQVEDVPVTWYDVAVKNLNETIIKFSMLNSSVYYNVTLFPMDTFHFNVLPRLYNITKISYYAKNGTYIKTETDTLNVTNDTFYIISGFTAHLFFGLYNTNEGLGIPWDTLKYFINGERLTTREYHTYINHTLNITIKDYYNQTLYTGNVTLNKTYTNLDFGLTFHSWKFGNTNDQYYIISLLKQGATRWWERGIVPFGELEFLIPSGNYTMRFYGANHTVLFNHTYVINNSKVWVINGTNLSVVVDGLSVITGQLLEVQGLLDIALFQDIYRVCYNVPTIFSILNPRATRVGIELVCPEITIIATATNSTADNDFISRPVMPTSSLSNGTIRIKNDRIYFHWNSSISWANISYGGNYTNYTAPDLPLFVDPFSANVTINASENVSIIRETQFQQENLFNWMKETQAQNDKYFYSTTVQLVNPFVTNVTMKEVYVYMGYANDTTPDYVTTKLYDVTNGVYVTVGQNFDCSASGIQFYLDSLTHVNRSFTASYYGKETQILPSSAYVSVNGYDMQTYNNLAYWHVNAQYVNHGTEAFIGSLGINFNFSTGDNIIAPQSLIVYDNEHSKYLSKINGEFMYLGPGGLMISQGEVGTVVPNSARTFDVYWLYTEPTTMEILPSSLHIVIIPSGVPFIGTLDVFYLLVILLGVAGIVAVIFAYDTKTHKFNMKIGFITVLCVVGIIILYGGY